MTVGAHRHQATIQLLCLVVLLLCGIDRAQGESAEDGPQVTPWFTGTLLSTRGTSLGKGHTVIEPYVYYTRYGGLYNDNWRLQSATTSQSLTQQTFFIYGLTDSLDIEIAPQWIGNHARSDSDSGFGDLPVQLGIQAWRSPAQSWLPDVRFWVQEIFPTGRYSDLTPAKADLERTGGGAYATAFGIALQKAIPFGGEHVLRYRFNATYGIYSSVEVRGFNAYGGGFGTAGRITPGSVTTVTVAAEYSLTRRLVLALDIGFQTVNATHFSGDPGLDAQGQPALVGRGASNLVTIAPALEYSWNQHVGVLAGPWMSLSGRNTSEFFGIVAALYFFL